MNSDAVTAFLPNFVGFPSLRGLHSSTVQPRRTPERAKNPRERGDVGVTSRTYERPPGRRKRTFGLPAGAHPAVRMRFPLPELSCPVSAASAASAPASPAGRPTATGRAPSAGGTRAARRTSGVPRAAGARRSAGPPAVPAPALTEPGGPDRHGHDDEQARQHDKGDDGHGHGVTLLSFPRGGPPWAPRRLA